MRVLQLGPYPPPYGGVQTNLVPIRSFLLRNGVPCSVINVTRHRKPNADNVYYPSNSAELLSLLARIPCDIVHQHFGGMLTNRILALSMACALRPGAKSIMSFHSGGFPSTPQGQALGPNSLAALVLRRFDGLIAVNEEIMGFFRRLGVPEQRVRIISPFSALTDEDADFPAPLAAFFSEHNPVLISAGQLEPEYDLALQIDALPQLREKSPNAGLVLLGSGSIEKDLRDRIAAGQCAEHILLAGDVPHGAAMEAISRSRILLRTTWYDGDAITVREAMQVGTPVIATDNAMRPPGIRLVPKSDLAALLHALEQELLQPHPRKERIPADQTSLEQVLDFYRDVLAGRTK